MDRCRSIVRRRAIFRGLFNRCEATSFQVRLLSASAASKISASTLRRSPKRAVLASTAACLSNGEVNLVKERPPNQHAAGVGPRAAIRKLHQKEMSLQEKLEFVEQARLDALLGACRLSLHSWKSGVKCYIAFIGTIRLFLGSGRRECLPVFRYSAWGQRPIFPTNSG